MELPARISKAFVNYLSPLFVEEWKGNEKSPKKYRGFERRFAKRLEDDDDSDGENGKDDSASDEEPNLNHVSQADPIPLPDMSNLRISSPALNSDPAPSSTPPKNPFSPISLKEPDRNRKSPSEENFRRISARIQERSANRLKEREDRQRRKAEAKEKAAEHLKEKKVVHSRKISKKNALDEDDDDSIFDRIPTKSLKRNKIAEELDRARKELEITRHRKGRKDRELLKGMMEMGFSEKASEAALAATSNRSLEDAIEYAFNHPEVDNSLPKSSSNNRKEEISPSLEHELSQEKEKNQRLQSELEQHQQMIQALRLQVQQLIALGDGTLEEIRRKEEEASCVICEESMIEVAFVPCGHLCSCQECSKKLNEECPVCRTKFHSVLRTFKI